MTVIPDGAIILDPSHARSVRSLLERLNELLVVTQDDPEPAERTDQCPTCGAGPQPDTPCRNYTARVWGPLTERPEDDRCVNCGQPEASHIGRHSQGEAVS